MNEFETMLESSSIDIDERMKALQVFSRLPEETRDRLLSLFRDTPRLLGVFWENYKAKERAKATGDVALWTSILEAEREELAEKEE